MPNKKILTDFCVGSDGVCTINPKQALGSKLGTPQDTLKSSL